MVGASRRLPCHLLRLPGSFGVRQGLVLEEALLRHDPLRRSWCVTAPGPTRPTIVLGLSGKPRLLVDLEACHAGLAAGRIEMIRRFTGGGTVVLGPDSLLVSWIVRDADPSPAHANPSPTSIMEWSEELYRPLFEQLLQRDVSFKLRENDYVVSGNLKFAGNAQAITRGDFVHHTSFLWDWDPAHMALLTVPQKQPEYRRHRPHSDFLTPLRRHVRSGQADHGSFWTALETAGRAHFDLQEEPLEPTLAQLEKSLREAGFDGMRGWERGLATDGTSSARGARTRHVTLSDLQAEKALQEAEANTTVLRVAT